MNLEGKRSHHSHLIDKKMKKNEEEEQGGCSVDNVSLPPPNCIIRLKCLSDEGEAATEH